MKKKLAIVLSTAREGRQSKKIADFVFDQAQKYSFKPKLIDVSDFLMAKTISGETPDPKARKWRKIAQKSDGFLFVIPEYNHSFPGELKILLDSAFSQYQGKPALLCGVSAGGLGGARVLEHIKPVLNALGMALPPFSVYFSNVGDFNPQDKKYSQNLSKLFAQID